MISEYLNDFHMWAVFVIVVGGFYFYANQKLPMEVTAFGIIVVLILLFYIAPYQGNSLDYRDFLFGFANPALITLLCLLVLGEAVNRTGMLDRLTNKIIKFAAGHRVLAIISTFTIVLVISGFLNNIPVVMLFIPVIFKICRRFTVPPGRYMMSLSFFSILGGMTTLIGSSTNLLVSSALIAMGREGFDFFTFTVPGIIMVLSGGFYVFFIMPFIMRHLGEQKAPAESYERDIFFMQFTLNDELKLVGKSADGEGKFEGLLDTVKLQFVKRGKKIFYPPFQSVTLNKGDVMVVAATQEEFEKMNENQSLEVFSGNVENHDEIKPDVKPEVKSLGRAEVVVVPNSSMIKRTISSIRFFDRYNCVVLGIKRRRARITQQIDDVKLEGGDVLLLQGDRDSLLQLKRSRNMILMEHSLSEVSSVNFLKRSVLIFSLVMLFAATGTVPILLATLVGVLAMLLLKIISVPNALRVMDGKIILVISASLALGLALEATGGADFIAILFVQALGSSPPAIVLSLFFLITALLSNMLSTKATAVLFTPIAVGIANHLGVDALPFAIAVVFASNCSFASPIGYQTNLLVMGPGGYEFKDFLKAGLPLIIVCWLTFTVLAFNFFNL
ncbi:MAG: SLC13 family permease [Alphaproteobacteria bacterium]|nr:SLC13 family permease [Alphaproteobacteria bacterium]